jgi:hypothetical protein
VFRHLTTALGHSGFPDDSVFHFQNLLAVTPEISELYERYYDEPPNLFGLYWEEQASADPYDVHLYILVKPDGAEGREIEEDEIYARIPELRGAYELGADLFQGQARKLTPLGLESFPDHLGIQLRLAGGNYLVRGVQYQHDGLTTVRYVDPALVDYVSMYILGMCVRYRQDLWRSVVAGDKSGVLGLVEPYAAVVKRRFPNTILDRFFGERFVFASAARLW